jgi:hypothetical protein
LIYKKLLLLLILATAANPNEYKNGLRISLNPLSLAFDKAIDLSFEYHLNPKNSISLKPSFMFTKYSKKPGVRLDYRFYFRDFDFIYLTEQAGLGTVRLEYKESDGYEITRRESDAIYGFQLSTGIGFSKQYKRGLSLGASISVGYLEKISKPTQQFQKIMDTEGLELSDIKPFKIMFTVQLGWLFKVGKLITE